jgi:hypothetical protein
MSWLSNSVSRQGRPRQSKPKSQAGFGCLNGSWGQKRDAYVRLIDALECIQVQRGLQRKGVQEAKHGERDAIAEFHRARALARLMLPPEVIVSIGRLLREMKKVDPTTATDPDYFESKERIEHARDAVVKAGKVDLALNPARAGDPTTT